MKIAVVGGTGVLGREVARQLTARAHGARVLSRRSPAFPIDLTTGAGLDHALAGCDVVVDASNDASRNAARTLLDGTRRLLEAEQRAGVRHHVSISIIGCERVPMGYFQAKAKQERIVEQSLVPWSIVRATQFHEFVVGMFAAAARWHMLPLPRARLQTVAAAEVAQTVVDVAEQAPRYGRVSVAGPEVSDVRDLAGIWRSTTGGATLLVPIILPGAVGTALRAGALTSDRPDVRGTVPFAAAC